MNEEDDEFNRIEREAKQRMEAVSATCRTTTPEDVRKIIKPWVDLTDREMMDAIDIDDSPMTMGRKIEAKLKEKNER
jgi:hypothetical protein